MKKISKRLLAVLITVISVISMFSATALSSSAATWKTGNVPKSGNTGYTTVRLTNTKKDAKIKIHSYTYLINPNKGTEKSTSFHVTMRTTSNRWIWEGDIKTGSSGKTMTLGHNYSAYKICLKQNSIPFGSWTLSYAKYYGIQCTSNCYI